MRLLDALERDQVTGVPEYGQILSKDWVSFVFHERDDDPFSGLHLFEHEEAKRFWADELRRRAQKQVPRSSTMVTGACSICGREDQTIIGTLPLWVKMIDAAPLHSLNKDAFVSYVGGSEPSKRSHLGLCFSCGDAAARAFNHLSNSPRHRRTLYRHPDRTKRDSLVNQIAIFWVKEPTPVETPAGDGDPIDFLTCDLGAVVNDLPDSPAPTLGQLDALLREPWEPNEAFFNIDQYAFYLAVLSPNVGRVALRDWFAVSIGALRDNLRRYFDACRMVTSWGEEMRAASVGAMVEAVGTGDPNLTRALLRTAYTGARPPAALAIRAGRRLNHLLANEAGLKERQQRRGRQLAPVWRPRWPHALAAAIKLGMAYGNPEEAERMATVNPLDESAAYHSGRLLAVLEEAQQLYHYSQYRTRLKNSIVVRSYGGAANAPAATIGALWKVASTAHLPNVPAFLRQDCETISQRLVELGGIPDHLTPAEQADFGLGFYQQRAQYRSTRPPAEQEEEGDEPIDQETEVVALDDDE